MQLIKNLIKNKKRYIAFVGDSFCATLSEKHYNESGAKLAQWYQADTPGACFPSLVADHYDRNLLAHGYGGRSWWFSRSQFIKDLVRYPKLIGKLDAIVFCHTDAGRINTDSEYAATTNIYKERSKSDCVNEEDWQVYQAHVLWHRSLYSEAFQDWAQQNWYREITREWANIKQVHFHCFAQTVKYNDLLIGQRFTTPLMHISMGELVGSTREINKQVNNDTRCNHLNDDNNRALAKVIIDALDNYENKVQPLDMSKFKILNHNYHHYPKGNYGSN